MLTATEKTVITIIISVILDLSVIEKLKSNQFYEFCFLYTIFT
jgi:hypothetical protein